MTAPLLSSPSASPRDKSSPHTLRLIALVFSATILSMQANGETQTTHELAPCPASPNCVSSLASEDAQRVEPMQLAGSPEAAWPKIPESILSLPRTQLAEFTGDYMRIEFKSRLFGFIDDLELKRSAEGSQVNVRSASRSGTWDLGVNRRRVESIRKSLREAGVIR